MRLRHQGAAPTLYFHKSLTCQTLRLLSNALITQDIDNDGCCLSHNWYIGNGKCKITPRAGWQDEESQWNHQRCLRGSPIDFCAHGIGYSVLQNRYTKKAFGQWADDIAYSYFFLNTDMMDCGTEETL